MSNLDLFALAAYDLESCTNINDDFCECGGTLSEIRCTFVCNTCKMQTDRLIETTEIKYGVPGTYTSDSVNQSVKKMQCDLLKNANDRVPASIINLAIDLYAEKLLRPCIAVNARFIHRGKIKKGILAVIMYNHASVVTSHISDTDIIAFMGIDRNRYNNGQKLLTDLGSVIDMSWLESSGTHISARIASRLIILGCSSTYLPFLEAYNKFLLAHNIEPQRKIMSRIAGTIFMLNISMKLGHSLAQICAACGVGSSVVKAVYDGLYANLLACYEVFEQYGIASPMPGTIVLLSEYSQALVKMGHSRVDQ